MFGREVGQEIYFRKSVHVCDIDVVDVVLLVHHIDDNNLKNNIVSWGHYCSLSFPPFEYRSYSRIIGYVCTSQFYFE